MEKIELVYEGDKRKHIARAIELADRALYMSTSFDESNPDTTLVYINENGFLNLWMTRREVSGDIKEKAVAIEEYLQELIKHIEKTNNLDDLMSNIDNWRKQEDLSFLNDEVILNDEKSLNAKNILFSKLDEKIINTLMDKDILPLRGKTRLYNFLLKNPEYTRMVFDIYDKHPWSKKYFDEEEIFHFLLSENDGINTINIHPSKALTFLINNGYFSSVDWASLKNKIKLHAISAVEGKNLDEIKKRKDLELFLLLSSLPPEWAKKWTLPENIETALKLKSITKVPDENMYKHVFDLLASTKGDITKYRNIGNTEVFDTSDFMLSFYHHISDPLLEKLNEDRDGEYVNKKYEVAAKLLGIGSLKKILELSNRWHEKEVYEINEKIRLNHIKTTWPALCENYIASNGLAIVSLTNVEQLENEGSRSKDKNGLEGLHHCVGSYYSTCMSGNTHILSVRKREGNSWKRVSTIEYKVNDEGLIDEIQHKGLKNSYPSDEALTAVREFYNAVKNKKHHLNLDEIEKYKNALKDRKIVNVQEKLENALIAWRPLIAKQYQGLNSHELVSILEANFFKNKKDNDSLKIGGQII